MQGLGLMVVVILMGIFSIACAALNVDWFMENRKTKIIVSIFGRNGARVFYGIIGIAIIVFAIIGNIKGQF